MTSGRKGPFFRTGVRINSGISDPDSRCFLDYDGSLRSAVYRLHKLFPSEDHRLFTLSPPEGLRDVRIPGELPDGTFFRAEVYKSHKMPEAYIGVLKENVRKGVLDVTLETNDLHFRDYSVNFAGLSWKEYQRVQIENPDAKKSNKKSTDKEEGIEGIEDVTEGKNSKSKKTREERERECSTPEQLGELVREVFEEMTRVKDNYETRTSLSDDRFFKNRRLNFAGFSREDNYILDISRHNIGSWDAGIPISAEICLRDDRPSKYLVAMGFSRDKTAVLRTNDLSVVSRDILVPWKKMEKSVGREK